MEPDQDRRAHAALAAARAYQAYCSTRTFATSFYQVKRELLELAEMYDSWIETGERP